MDVLDLLLQHCPVPIVDYDLPPLAANVKEEEQQGQEEEAPQLPLTGDVDEHEKAV